MSSTIIYTSSANQPLKYSKVSNLETTEHVKPQIGHVPNIRLFSGEKTRKPTIGRRVLHRYRHVSRIVKRENQLLRAHAAEKCPKKMKSVINRKKVNLANRFRTLISIYL